MSSTSPILLPPPQSQEPSWSSFAIIPSHSWMVILLLWFWEIQVVTFEEQLTLHFSPLSFSGQAVFYGLLNRIWIPHQMLVVWATAKAPGKTAKDVAKFKTFKLNYIPLKNSLGLVRHTQTFSWEIYHSCPRWKLWFLHDVWEPERHWASE